MSQSYLRVRFRLREARARLVVRVLQTGQGRCSSRKYTTLSTSRIQKRSRTNV
ncbi:hypothetical protein DICSQDRAFT_139443 [Dichomitus squalens LYAD-421 SS1]|uniref:Uncharacterized protein n=1 Tax=Dichomitus squalens (strain LYAD-421) TaxID=732165 RepID=R7SQZ3_DICSQ|nr:uncharacterized protein DICSQDRAFT_139443 [Dichomitus squalens LYAD-421 SS1]EJF58358.1 hypothetical protein DICSQDRAFT_139443 [Dichomitus squalens LYAD-421 SS1]